MPLVVEARDWAHGVYLGATVSSEATAAAEGTVGRLRRDPFAMTPFYGYNAADHWAHWLSIGKRLREQGGRVPRIFQVNWFRKDDDGAFLWPGFGENSRVIEWILGRVDGRVAAVESPVGLMPTEGGINVDGLDISESDLTKLFAVNHDEVLADVDGAQEYFATFEGRVPAELIAESERLRALVA